MAQISEFSLILGALGFSLGHIDAETMGLITLVGLITISVSTYMIIYSHPLYDFLSPWLKVFERQQPSREMSLDSVAKDEASQIILFGLGRFGKGIVQALRERNYHVTSVDYDPELVQTGDFMGNPVLYGDAEDPEFIASLPLTNVEWIVSTTRDYHVSQVLLQTLKRLGYAGRIAVAAHKPDDVIKLKQAGADLVLEPYVDAAREAAFQFYATSSV